MLIIQRVLMPFKLVLNILPAILTFILSTNLLHADSNQTPKSEPISPIPKTIVVNSAKAELGKKLFSDRRLSKDNTLSCATCHQLESGGDDNVELGISLTAKQHIVNTPSIFNAVFNFRQNWDGSAKSLEEQIDMVMSNKHEFNNTWAAVAVELSQDKELNKSFKAVYQNGISRENIINALVEFETTLITPNARFDRYLRNETDSLTKTEIEGYKLFKEYGCVSCHQGMNIGGNLFQKFGIFYNYLAERGNIKKQDYGKYNTTNRQMDKFVFKVPSLRNVSVTSPYLHDGSAQTIEEAISIMGKTQLGRTLNDSEISLIKSFLNTLTGEYQNKPLGGAS